MAMRENETPSPLTSEQVLAWCMDEVMTGKHAAADLARAQLALCVELGRHRDPVCRGLAIGLADQTEMAHSTQALT